MTMNILFLALYLLMAIVLQVFIGNFPSAFMAFPLNVLFMALWGIVLLLLYQQEKHVGIIRHLLSPTATFYSLSLTFLGCLIIGIYPQKALIDIASENNLAATLGFYHFHTSWIFVAILLYIQSVLFLVTIRGWRNQQGIRWRFLLCHIGLWLIISSIFFGAADKKTLRVIAYKNHPTKEAIQENGHITHLPYEVCLQAFHVDYFPNGTPSHFEANVLLGSDSARLAINHPHSYSLTTDVYLTDYDTTLGSKSNYCILQIVYEPWKWFTACGIWILLIGAILLFIQGPTKKHEQ